MKQYAAFPVGKVPIHLKADFPFPTSGFRLPFLFPLPVIMFEMIAFYYVKYKIHQRDGKQSGFPAYGCKTLFKNNPAFLHAVPVQHVIEAQQPQKSHNCIYGYRPHHFTFLSKPHFSHLFKRTEKKDGIHGRHNDQKKPGTLISIGAAAP